MPVALLKLELEIPHAQSLKDRRQVVRSIKDTLRRAFNISIAEIDGALVWNRATLQIVAVSGSSSYLAGQLAAVERRVTAIATRTGAEVRDSYAEMLPEGGGDAFETDVEALSPEALSPEREEF